MAIPNIEQRFLDAAGRIDVVWHRFLRELGPITDIADLQAAVAALQDALAAIGTPRDVIGQYSVQAIPGDGAYYLHLLGDTEEPGFTYYYGTGPDGLKGWYPVADTVEAAADELTKAVDAEGVVTFGLADTAVTPGTYTNATVTVDQKGRVTFAESGQAGAVPYEVADGTVYAVPAGYQALFTIPIDLLGTGSIDLSGALVEVS